MPLAAWAALLIVMANRLGGPDPVGRRRLPCRRCVRRRPSRRSRRAPCRRAVWHAGARDCGHGDRSRADRLADALARRRQGGAGARHRIRRDHDRVQRNRRDLPPAGRAPASRAGLPSGRRERGAGGARGIGGAGAGAAELRDVGSRADVVTGATRVLRHRVAPALWRVRLHPDGPPPRIFPARGSLPRGRARSAAVAVRDLDECRTPVGFARRGRRTCEGAFPGDRIHRCGVGRAGRCGRRHHRVARALAGGPRRRTRGACRQAADEPQPCARLGAREHRSHHSRDRGDIHRDGPAAGPGPRGEGNCAAGADAAGRRDHARHRTHHGPARRRTPRDLRGVRCSCPSCPERRYAEPLSREAWTAQAKAPGSGARPASRPGATVRSPRSSRAPRASRSRTGIHAAFPPRRRRGTAAR